MPAGRCVRLVLVALVLSLCTLQAQTTFYVVDRVIDGDTLVLGTLGTVRLIGVDAPESMDPRKSVQADGLEAAAFLKRLIGTNMVRVEFEGPRLDSFKRTLAYVYLGDGTLVNAEIIRQGYGHVYTVAPFSQLEQFRGFEREARTVGRGLWAAPSAPTALVTATSTAQSAETVFVTKSGTKYHRAGCRHLARSQIPMSVADAAARYGPCSVCRPPPLASAPALSLAPSTPAPRAAAPASSSAQCAATTKKGTRRSRRAQAGRTYCWQH